MCGNLPQHALRKSAAEETLAWDQLKRDEVKHRPKSRRLERFIPIAKKDQSLVTDR